MPGLLREKLAKLAHDVWARWMKYQWGKSRPIRDDDCPRCSDSTDDHVCPPSRPDGMKIPQDSVERWTRQMNTEYEALPENEKTSDREIADEFLAAIFPEPAVYPDVKLFMLRNVTHENELAVYSNLYKSRARLELEEGDIICIYRKVKP